MTRTTSRLLLGTVAALGFLAAACGDDSGSSATTAAASTAAATTAAPTSAAGTTTAGSTAAGTTAKPVTGSITVFAAASLTESFKAIGDAFSKANPGTKVTFSFDASSALAQQIQQGAPADVFASADTANMDKVKAANLTAGDPVVFATNTLEIIVPAGNPKGIKGLSDLSQQGLKVVLCAPQVPCGKYAQQSLDKAGVKVTPVSQEQNVKGVVTKVTAGEADAGIVYVTDVNAAGAKAAGVPIPAEYNVPAKYPAAPLTASKSPDTAKAFVSYLLGPDAQAILAKAGFTSP